MIPSSFFVETLPLSIMDTRGNFPAFSDTPCFRFKGTPSDFLETLRELSAKHSGLRYALNSPDSWTGITSESPLEALKTGYSRDALKTFQGAAAALSTPLQKGTPRLAPEGSSYSMARVIQGHPIAAFKRPKIKLPPKALEFSVNCMGGVDPTAIAKAVSRIARAAWEYQAAGGPVTVTAHYLYSLCIPRDGVIAAIVSLSLPLANLSQFATGASVQMYRGFCMPLRNTVLAGSCITGAPVMRWNNPRVFPINGEEKNDEKSLAALGVA